MKFSIVLLLLSFFACTTTFAEEFLKQAFQSSDTAKLVSPVADSAIQEVVTGKFEKTNEEGDFWFFYIADKSGKEIKFIYNSEDILKAKKGYEGKVLKVRYREKEFEEAGSGDKFTEKYLLSVEIKK
jgi:hypothetical protein